MFSRSLVYRNAPVPVDDMTTPLQRHLANALDAMRDTTGLTVDDDAGYDVLAVAVVRFLGSVPHDAKAEDLLAALSHRALTLSPIEVA